MAKRDALTQFSNIDFELFEEYATGLDEAVAVIERNMGHLASQPDDMMPVATLFRAFHNLKGDAALCRFEYGMQVAHAIESLLMRLRDGQLRFTPMLGEALLLALDRLELTVEAILAAKPTAQLRLELLLDNLEALAAAPATRLDGTAADMIERVSGFRPAAKPAATASRPSAATAQPDAGSDMAFFRLIAHQFEQRSPLFAGRTARLLQLALAMNDLGKQQADPTQLEAAVYLHDIGMMLLPEPLWLKAEKLNVAERAQMRQHPEFGAGLLERMPSWADAARMVAQHHETPDGKGYPRGLKAAAISPGAKILSIADAFEAVMLKHRHRGQNLSVLRAAAEVNACEGQFAQEWITPFNQAVRRML